MRLKFLKETIKEFNTEVHLRNVPLLLKTSYRNTWETIKEIPRNLMSLAFVMTLSLFVAAMAGPFWVVYAVTVVEFTSLEWGTALFLVGLFNVAFAIPAGAIVDKFGKRNVLIVAFTLSILPVFLFTYCKTFMQLVTVLTLITAVGMLLTPACQALVADIVPREKRGRITAAFGRGSVQIRVGAVTAGFLPSIGSVLGSIAGGFIYTSSPTYPWILLSVTLFFCLIITILFIKEPEKIES